MNILGISAYYHDSAAALLRDGAILLAAKFRAQWIGRLFADSSQRFALRCLLLQSRVVSNPFVDLKAYATATDCKSPEPEQGPSAAV